MTWKIAISIGLVLLFGWGLTVEHVLVWRIGAVALVAWVFWTVIRTPSLGNVLLLIAAIFSGALVSFPSLQSSSLILVAICLNIVAGGIRLREKSV